MIGGLHWLVVIMVVNSGDVNNRMGDEPLRPLGIHSERQQVKVRMEVSNFLALLASHKS